MRFRRLTKEELIELEKEFVHFLASNGIEASDWVKMKAEEIDKAEEFIDQFSDIVLKKVLEKIDFLEKREQNNILFFKFTDSCMETIGLMIDDQSLDLRDDEVIAQLATKASNVKTFKSSTNYTKEREDEIFSLTQAGSIISDGKIFNLLKNS